MLREVTSAPDLELLDGWARGDRACGNELFSRHYMSIRRFFEVKAGHAADDLTQRTFLACIEARDRFARASSFRTFLFAIARHNLLGYLRKDRRGDRARRLVEAQGPDTAITPSGLISRQQEQRLLLLALNGLSAQMQIPLQLYYWEGMKGAEIAEVLEIPASTVRNRLSRARVELAERVRSTAPNAQVSAAILEHLEDWTRSLPSHDNLGIAFDRLVPVRSEPAR
jgi:RNA polymerase sigma-70 factor (ECF subfamily)